MQKSHGGGNKILNKHSVSPSEKGKERVGARQAISPWLRFHPYESAPGQFRGGWGALSAPSSHPIPAARTSLRALKALRAPRPRPLSVHHSPRPASRPIGPRHCCPETNRKRSFPAEAGWAASMSPHFSRKRRGQAFVPAG